MNAALILLGLALIYFAWFVFWPWYDRYTAARPLKQHRRFSSAPGSIFEPVRAYADSTKHSGSDDARHNDDAATAMLLHTYYDSSRYDSPSHCDSSSSYDSGSCDSGSSDCGGGGDSGGGGCD